LQVDCLKLTVKKQNFEIKKTSFFERRRLVHFTLEQSCARKRHYILTNVHVHDDTLKNTEFGDARNVLAFLLYRHSFLG